MINLGLKYGQLMAERANIQRMTLPERTALWYRLERIGKEPEELFVEPPRITMISTRIDIDKKALELQKRIVSLEEEIKRMRTYANKKTNRYTQYT